MSARDPRIGELMRKGVTIYYVTDARGRNFESSRLAHVERFLGVPCSDSELTHGPWIFDNGCVMPDGNAYQVGGVTYARPYLKHGAIAQLVSNPADGRAIAALPDLIEALRIVANCVPDAEGGTTLGSYEMGMVRAALAKAGA